MIQFFMLWSMVVVLSVYAIVLTPSILMVCLLASSGFSVYLLFTVFKMKLGAMIMSLIVIGGLFVLLSFVVLSMPWDYSKIVEAKDMWWLVWSSFGCCFWLYEMESEILNDWMISGEYCLVFVYLIMFLLLSLGIFYSLVKVSKGTSFSKS